MSLLSDFRQRIKVKQNEEGKETKEKRYSIYDIHFRLDSETGRINVYRVKKPILQKKQEKAWTIHRIEKTDINLEDKGNKIHYTLEISPSGLFWDNIYADENDRKRYGHIYANSALFYQLYGESYSDKGYTENELLELVKKINNDKDKAKYYFLYKVKHDDNYTGTRLLEGKFIAESLSKQEDGNKELICLEDENIKISFNENNIIASLNGEQEVFYSSDLKMQQIEQVYYHPRSRRYYTLDGFTPAALRKLIKEHEKEKEGEERDE